MGWGNEFGKNMPIKILQKKLLKQDFLHLDIGNRQQKDFW